MPYPVTIVMDRYGGTYSGGVWIAWPLCAEDVPPEPASDDVTAMTFWGEAKEYPFGRGATPNEALADLRAPAK